MIVFFWAYRGVGFALAIAKEKPAALVKVSRVRVVVEAGVSGFLPFLEVFNHGAHQCEYGGSGCGKYGEHQ